MAYQRTKQDGFSVSLGKDGKPCKIVYKAGAVSADGTLVEDYIRAHRITRLAIDTDKPRESVASLAQFPGLESVMVANTAAKERYDCSVFNRLPNLKSLGCELQNATLSLPNLEELTCTFGKNAVIGAECKNLRHVSVSRCKDYAALGGTLKSLKFGTGAGTGVADWSPLSELVNLEELVFSNHAVIPDLRFLEPLAKLKDVRIVGTKITAEDVSPLCAIESVSYFHTGIDKKLDAYLTERQRDFRIKVQERVRLLAKERQ